MLNFTFLDYVECIKVLLFTLGNNELERIRKKLEKKVPKPLSTQFEDRLSKPDSVKKYVEKKSTGKTTTAFPASKRWSKISVL